MSYEIIILDIDGTLVNSKKVITEHTLSTLLNLQKLGKKVALASGRPIQGILGHAKTLHLNDFGGYILAYNGGAVINASTNEVMYSKYFPNELIPEICEELKNTNVTINTYEGDKIIEGNALNKYSDIESRIVGMEAKFVENFAEYVTFDINKLLLAGDPDEILRLEKLFSERYKGVIGVFRSEEFFLELVPLGVDKAKSIDVLLSKLGLTSEQCIACGDGYNDITMIQYAGLGVAMGNAVDEVKAAANLITVTNDEDGVAKIVEEYML
ncbi:MAG: Cof-type HAD-IIB family hydrolase [Acutalibacteraceae bacterium]|nr:Cof-type HAD-IIB family hydrolase [Acutalibacteraceae bacterium]